MDPNELMQQARDALTVKRVFGEPYERDGVTVIPAASIRGGAGGGEGRGRGAGRQRERLGLGRWVRADGEAGGRLRHRGRPGALATGRRRQPDHPRRPGRRHRPAVRGREHPPPPAVTHRWGGHERVARHRLAGADHSRARCLHEEGALPSPVGRTRSTTRTVNDVIRKLSLDTDASVRLARSLVTRPFTSDECTRYFPNEHCPTVSS